jgi:asparagine synthase (glutamine-hydrolysing)
VDRASMKFSLEGRVPFLDHRIVEFAINVDPSLKYNYGIPKYILKEVLYHFLPEKIFDRPKQGFSIPLEKWLRNELAFLLDEYLSEDKIKASGLFNWPAVKSLKDRFAKGESRYYNRIWSLLMVQIWYNRNFH